MIERKHRTYVFLELDDVKFSSSLHGLERLELRLQQCVLLWNRWNRYRTSDWQRRMVPLRLDTSLQGRRRWCIEDIVNWKTLQTRTAFLLCFVNTSKNPHLFRGNRYNSFLLLFPSHFKGEKPFGLRMLANYGTLPSTWEISTLTGLAGAEEIKVHVNKEKLLIDLMGEDDTRIWAGKRKAALDSWLNRLAALLSLDAAYKGPSVLLQSDGKCLLTRKEWPPQCEHNDFEVIEREFSGYFIIITCSEP